eukprot:8703967-Alexandrium_andersonii.AAC.1
MADCGLELANSRLSDLGPPQSQFSPADSESARKKRRGAHPSKASDIMFEAIPGPARFKCRAPEAITLFSVG